MQSYRHLRVTCFQGQQCKEMSICIPESFVDSLQFSNAVTYIVLLFRVWSAQSRPLEVEGDLGGLCEYK